MDGINWGQVILMLLGGGGCAGIGVIVGHFVQRSTTIDTSKIADRQKLTETLMEQLEKALEAQGEIHASMVLQERRERVYVRLLLNIRAENRVIMEALAGLLEEVDGGVADNQEIKKRTSRIMESFRTVQEMINKENRYLEEELKANQEAKQVQQNAVN